MGTEQNIYDENFLLVADADDGSPSVIRRIPASNLPDLPALASRLLSATAGSVGQVPVVTDDDPYTIGWGSSGGLTLGEVATSATGDGTTNDLAAIISDLSSLSSAGGGTLVFKRGTYLCGISSSSGVLITVPSNCKLRGVGPGVTVLKSASTVTHAFIGTSGATNAGIENLTLDANTTTNSSNAVIIDSASVRCFVRGCTITAKWGWGTLVKLNSTLTEITDNVYEGSTNANTVEINGASYTDISRNRILGSGNNCIEIYDTVANHVVGTRMIGNHLASAASSGIACFGDIGSVISGNVIRSCSTYGIYGAVSETNASQPWTGAQITGNTVDSCNTASGAYAIYSDSGIGIGIVGNTVMNTAGTGGGIGINSGSSCTISSNIATQNGGNGIYVNSTATRIAVIGNAAINNSGATVNTYNGIVVNATSCTVVGNIGNDTRGGSNRQQFGVFVSGASNTIIGNRGTGNTNVGVYVTGASCVQLANDNTNTPTALAGHVGFYGATPAAKPTVSGAKGSNAALGSLLTALSTLGLVTDSSSA